MEIGTLKMAPKLISTWTSQMILNVFWIVMFFRSTSRRWGVILLNAEQEKEVSKRIEDGVMEMKRVFCSLPVQDYLEKLLLDLKNNKSELFV